MRYEVNAVILSQRPPTSIGSYESTTLLCIHTCLPSCVVCRLQSRKQHGAPILHLPELTHLLLAEQADKFLSIMLYCHTSTPLAKNLKTVWSAMGPQAGLDEPHEATARSSSIYKKNFEKETGRQATHCVSLRPLARIICIRLVSNSFPRWALKSNAAFRLGTTKNCSCIHLVSDLFPTCLLVGF